jgi:hypothetical protein
MIETTPTPTATKAPKRWSGFSAKKNSGAFVRGIINLVLVTVAVRDIRRRRDDEIKGKRKFWMFAAFAPPIGPIAYFLFGRKRDTAA